MSKLLENIKMEERIKILDLHLRAESNYDIDSIMKTYGKDPFVIINGLSFNNYESIKTFHEKMGFGQSGSFSELKVIERKRYLTDDAIVIEQILTGKHTGKYQGILPTGKVFEIPVCTIYLFDEESMLAGEKVFFDNALLLKQLKADI